VTTASARRLLARAVGFEAVDAVALAAAKEAWGSWRRLAEVLKQEKLAALLGYRLGHGAEFPGDSFFREYLRDAVRGTLAANLKLRKDFERMRGILAMAGIPALPIKGVDVAFASFPSPACRPMADVDVLVSPDDYAAAQEVLQREGFAPLRPDAKWWPARSFFRGSDTVDLHWSPAAALPPRRGMASLCYVSGREELVRDEFRLLVSVCHHQNHFFSLPLLYFWESAWLARRVSWPAYWPLARRWGVARTTRFVLDIAFCFFGGGPGVGGFRMLKALAAPALAGRIMGRGARSAASYAFSLDNPMSALVSGFRRPAWARRILTGSPAVVDGTV